MTTTTSPDAPAWNPDYLAETLWATTVPRTPERAALEILLEAPGDLLSRADVVDVLDLDLIEDTPGTVDLHAGRVDWSRLRHLAGTLDGPTRAAIQLACWLARPALAVPPLPELLAGLDTSTWRTVTEALAPLVGATVDAPGSLSTVDRSTVTLHEADTRGHSWYRALDPDGRVWCESSNPDEVAASVKDRTDYTLETMTVYSASTTWKPWTRAAMNGDADE
jgi:hypothetical protein